jgi:hypothetical protein
MRFSCCVIGILEFVCLNGYVAVAQQVAIGIIGGVRTTDDVSGNLRSESKRYIGGPMAEIRLPMRLSFELDALYRRFGFTGYQSSCCGSSITRERANSWEFPMVLKYSLPVMLARPFVGVGYAPRTIHGTDVSSGSYLSGISQNPPMSIYTYFFNQHSDTSYSLTHGVLVSGGVNLGAGHLQFSPEVRYVHWNAPFLSEFGGDGSFRFVSKQDEFFVLLGVSWH